MALLLAAALACLLGCSRSDQWTTSYRLERLAALAHSNWTSNSVAVGSEGANAHLIDGWSFAESNPAGDSFRWSNAASSTFGFMVFEPSDAVLTLRGLSFPSEPSDTVGPQEVTVSVGGRPIGSVTVGRGFAVHQLPVSRESLVIGRNDFALDYAWVRSDLASQQSKRWQRGQRNLAAAWTTISLAAEGEVARPAPKQPPTSDIDLIDASLALPVGSWIEFELELAAGSRLRVDSITCAGCEPDTAVVDVFLGGVERTEIEPLGQISAQQTTLDLVPRVADQPLREQLARTTKTLVLRTRLDFGIGDNSQNPPVPAGTESPEALPSQQHIVLGAPTIERPPTQP